MHCIVSVSQKEDCKSQGSLEVHVEKTVEYEYVGEDVEGRPILEDFVVDCWLKEDAISHVSENRVVTSKDLRQDGNVQA